MELHQLRYVLAVVDTGSFTAASIAVNVSQSGVSTQVQKLERELGVSLFDRSSRRVTLSPDGERLVPSFR
ncbi:MAG: LysR family transcriptional regulator, partial [Microbacterium sp.]